MVSLLQKKEGLTDEEFVIQKSLVYFGMTKKIKDDSIEKIMSDENL